MDIYNMYLGDHYGALRNPMYRDYEKHPYGAWEASSANANANKTCYQTKSYQGQQQSQQQHQKTGKSKEPCPFCKEQKKRPLVAYIRKRDNKKHTESICEEDEAAEETKTK